MTTSRNGNLQRPPQPSNALTSKEIVHFRNNGDVAPSKAEEVEAIRHRFEEQALVAEQKRDELLTVATHDLRNPLGVVLVTTTLLARELTQSNQLEQVAAMRRAAIEMTHVIEDLVDGASMDAGTFEVVEDDCDAVEVVREAVAAARMVIGERPIVIEEILPVGLPRLRMPRYRLLQVFSRIVANALRSMPKAGSLVFEVVQERQTLRFSVTDSGPVVPESQRPYAFQRKPPPDRRSCRCTGLGMFVVKGIVEAHGGRVELVSDEARGNRVSFTLPV